MRRQLYGEESPEYAITLRNLGLVAQRECRLDDAQRVIEQGRDLLVRKQGVRGAEYARTMHLLGELHAAREMTMPPSPPLRRLSTFAVPPSARITPKPL